MGCLFSCKFKFQLLTFENYMRKCISMLLSVNMFDNSSKNKFNRESKQIGTLLSFFYPFHKLKEFADDNFLLDENGRKLSKRVGNTVENTVGKGEIACYKQFLLFQQCFHKTFSADT